MDASAISALIQAESTTLVTVGTAIVGVAVVMYAFGKVRQMVGA